MVVFDTFALMKFLRKEAGYELVREKLQRGGIICEGTVYELLHVCTKDSLEQGHDLHESIQRASGTVESILVHLQRQNITLTIAREAVYFKRKYNQLNLSNFDCLALGTAKILEQPLLSGEKGLAQVKEVQVEG